MDDDDDDKAIHMAIRIKDRTQMLFFIFFFAFSGLMLLAMIIFE